MKTISEVATHEKAGLASICAPNGGTIYRATVGMACGRAKASVRKRPYISQQPIEWSVRLNAALCSRLLVLSD